MTDRLEPTLEDTLRLYAERYGKEATFGDLPAKVLTYNPAEQTANVQPLVLASRNDQVQPVAILQQVQVRWPAGATWSIVGDLVAGDFGWLRFAGADISAWKMTALELDPNADKRSGALSDCVFEPGSQPVSVPLAADAYKVAALVIKAAELLLGDSTAVDFVALASLVKANDDAHKTWADAHSHGPGTFVAPSGGGPVTGQSSSPTMISPPGPDPSPTPGNVAATKVKAK